MEEAAAQGCPWWPAGIRNTKKPNRLYIYICNTGYPSNKKKKPRWVLKGDLLRDTDRPREGGHSMLEVPKQKREQGKLRNAHRGQRLHCRIWSKRPATL